LLLFPRQQVSSRWRRQPIVQTYNLVTHEVNSDTCVQRQLHLDAA
jgi:hypothetical protein